jgi:CopA family copper-resistance protein
MYQKKAKQLLRMPMSLSRRKFVTTTLASAAMLGLQAGRLQAQEAGQSWLGLTLRGHQFDLDISYLPVNFTGNQSVATAINKSLPAPLLRWREGDELTLRVKNNLAVDSSIHWHGIILPSNMDGVPGLSFSGIRPGESFEYRFQVNQSGTYWYHGHSGYQEQTGLYGPIIVEPREPDPVDYQREYVVMLSDWSDSEPAEIYSTLRKQSHYYNFNKRTLGDIFSELRNRGLTQTWRDRGMWNQMRMSDRDIADVTAYTYTYLMNGISPDPGWLGLFQPGEKVRLRFINASAMTIFDVRIPGLSMRVVAADGQNIEPVSVDEFRIGVAETYDVIVEPESDAAYAVFAQSIDRGGYALGTLSADASMQPEVPVMDPRPVLGMADMGMDMSSMQMSDMNMNMNMNMSDESMSADTHQSAMDMTGMNMNSQEMTSHEHHAGMDMSSMNASDMSEIIGPAGQGMLVSMAPLWICAAKVLRVDLMILVLACDNTSSVSIEKSLPTPISVICTPLWTGESQRVKYSCT